MSTAHPDGPTALPDIPADHPANRTLDLEPPPSPPPALDTKPPAKTRANRASKAKDQAADAGTPGESAASKPARKPRGNGKAKEGKAEDADKAQTAPAPAPAPKGEIPPITREAMNYINNPAASVSDLFRLQADSRRFVQYHITNMHRLEAESEATTAHLLATGPKISPAFQKVADAILSRHRPAHIEAVTAAAQWTTAASPPVQVQLGKMDTPAARADNVIGTALGRLTDYDAAMTRQELAERVAGNVEAIRGFDDPGVKHDAIAYSHRISTLHPDYGAEFARQAPDLAAAGQAVATAKKTPDVENTIEPGTTVVQQATPVQANTPAIESPAIKPPQTTAAPLQPEPAASIASRLLRTVGNATQKAGAWLADRGKASPSPVSLAKPPTGQAAAAVVNPVPDHVANRFLKVDEHFYFPDKTHAFTDHGQKLATRGHHPEVVRSLVEIAKARGWDSITVKGTDEFRRNTWMEAAQSGLKVTGYKPTPLDLAALANTPARNTVEQVAEKQRPAASGKMPASRADASKPNPELAKQAASFETDKPAYAVKRYPELAPAYGLLEAAKAFAAEHLPPESRDAFVGIARKDVMQKIMAGQQVKGPKILATQAQGKEAGDQAKATEAADLGKSARDRTPARER